jgi:hypothetical protein
MRKWNLPLTYEPKIQPVIDGTIRQTIRTGRKFSVGDLVRFYKWTGRPYRSPRITITEYQQIIICLDIIINHEGIRDVTWEQGFVVLWNGCDGCAALDGIVPPTGEALKKVLAEKNIIPAVGVEAQIIRW